ncbi:MAG: hypothetical protein P8M49_04980 [Thalassotalea sp.]|nr:hypothetical protein [Thalassotalea sp.]
MFIFLVSILLLLMVRSSLAEYKYYQAVKSHEPDVWAKLDSPKFLKNFIVFVSPEGAKLLKGITNQVVCKLGNNFRQARMHFLSYVILVLVISVIYFKVA